MSAGCYGQYVCTTIPVYVHFPSPLRFLFPAGIAATAQAPTCECAQPTIGLNSKGGGSGSGGGDMQEAYYLVYATMPSDESTKAF